MLDLDAGPQIAHLTAKLLSRADADGRLPTPVGDIIAAAGLEEPSESLLSESAIGAAPEHLRSKLRRLRSKVHAVVDRRAREVHVHPDISRDGQRRFKQLHEVGHDILPWQKELAYADDATTLSLTTNIGFEQEANQTSAELLFQRLLFERMAAEYEIGVAAFVELAGKFGASYHASFRRYVETHGHALAGLVLDASPCRTDPLGYRRREVVLSGVWAERFDSRAAWPAVLCADAYGFVNEVKNVNGPATPACDWTYPNISNEPTELHVELFSNSYSVFALIWLPRRERFRRKRLIVPSSAAQ